LLAQIDMAIRAGVGMGLIQRVQSGLHCTALLWASNVLGHPACWTRFGAEAKG